jgi:TonB family protein
MKKPLILMGVLLLAAAGSMGQEGTGNETQSWKRYTVENRAFSVTLPATPVLTISAVVDQGLKVRLEHKLEIYAFAVVYSAYVYENPKPRHSMKDFIDEHTRKGWDSNTQRNVTLNGVSGKEYVSQDKHVIAQFFSTEQRLYRFETTGAPAEDPRVRQFFSSIALGEKTEGVKIEAASGVVYYREKLQDVYKGKEVEGKARLITKPEPAYTEAAQKNGITGTVVLRCVFSSTGRVVNITVVSGLPDGLTEVAIEAARKIRFRPATKGGKPVSMWMQLEYNFNF